MNFWSETFLESLEKFRLLARQKDAVLNTYVLPDKVGPDGEPLTIDIAWIGPRDAECVLLNTNGVHGCEYYPGAAAQLALMSSDELSLPDNCAVVLIHALNPFGCAYGTQRNENGVDLNRNFVDFFEPPSSSTIVHDIANAVTIDEMSFDTLVAATNRLSDLVNGERGDEVGQALMAGQYLTNSSLKFGGGKPQWSNVTFREFLNDHLQHAKHILFLDWHTGLGEYGGLFHIPCASRGTPEWDRTNQMWQNALTQGASSTLMDGEFGKDVAGDDLSGLVVAAVHSAVPNASICGGVIEFGTVPFKMIVQATILDHWMWNHVDDTSSEVKFWRAMLRTMFAPRRSDWQVSAAEHARVTYDGMLNELRALATE